MNLRNSKPEIIINHRGGDTLTMDRTKKVLITLLAIGALATLGVGTFASFNATTTNGGNTFQTGTILLSNTATGGAATGTACFSYNAATFTNNNSNACDVIVTSGGGTPNAANQKPTNASSSAVIKLVNTGTIDAKLNFGFTCATGAQAAIHGNGTVCNYLAVTIQPCNTYTGGATCTTTSAYCVYSSAGKQTGSTCGLPALATNPNTTTPVGSLADLALPANFGTTGPINNGTGTQISLTNTSGNFQAYQVTWQFIDSGTAGFENPAQGQTANFNLTWTIA
jgi:predicted ribosomally synthesized peptide with SipW-like signal peptide